MSNIITPVRCHTAGMMPGSVRRMYTLQAEILELGFAELVNLSLVDALKQQVLERAAASSRRRTVGGPAA